MGRNQGLIRYRNGVIRKLTKSEVARGYLFISMDRRLPELLNTANFVVEISGENFENRKIDTYGRTQIPTVALAAIGARCSVRIDIESPYKLIVTKIPIST